MIQKNKKYIDYFNKGLAELKKKKEEIEIKIKKLDTLSKHLSNSLRIHKYTKNKIKEIKQKSKLKKRINE